MLYINYLIFLLFFFSSIQMIIRSEKLLKLKQKPEHKL